MIESPHGEFAGWAGLGPVGDADTVEFGWYLTSDHWGRGYATEATRLLVEFAFGTLGIRRLIATVDPENAASRCVLEKSGLNCLAPQSPCRRGAASDRASCTSL